LEKHAVERKGSICGLAERNGDILKVLWLNFFDLCQRFVCQVAGPGDSDSYAPAAKGKGFHAHKILLVDK
jgi:hypothetical protein